MNICGIERVHPTISISGEIRFATSGLRGSKYRTMHKYVHKPYIHITVKELHGSTSLSGELPQDLQAGHCQPPLK